jgi:DNA-binding response OmpR family regulator
MSGNGGLRILIVEDEMMVVLELEDMIREMGHVVVASATRIDAALECARSVECDVAILDVNVAGRMSFPVAEALRARGIPFIFATGYGASALPEEFRDQVILHKPFRMSDIMRELSVHARDRRQSDPERSGAR